MIRYDPAHAPDAQTWLALDELERIGLAEASHAAERVELPNAKAHAVFHAVVENQIAEGLPSVVRAMARLHGQGLSRHDCIHAVGWVLALHLHEAMSSSAADEPAVAQARYDAAVERLTAASWFDQAGS